MKPIAFSKTLRTVLRNTGVMALTTVIVNTQVQQTAQAQLGSPGMAYMPCSEAYFSDPDFMYGSVGSVEFLEQLEQRGQLERYQQAVKPGLDEIEAINASVNVFAVELDAPIGYVANKVSSVAVEIPLEIEQAFQEEMAYPYSREKVKMLNEKYGQYATFGQQITLVYSPAQTLRVHEILREQNAIATSYLTDKEKQEYRDLVSSGGPCPVNYGVVDAGIGTIVVEVGQRPDLDARLRDDTTGATFFR